MRQYDVPNGDAHGICALHPLRLTEPRGSMLVTGTKRDIAHLPAAAQALAQGSGLASAALASLRTLGEAIRAPQRNPRCADNLCRAFPGDGGRAAATGIDRLPVARLQEFVAAFAGAYPGGAWEGGTHSNSTLGVACTDDATLPEASI